MFGAVRYCAFFYDRHDVLHTEDIWRVMNSRMSNGT